MENQNFKTLESLKPVEKVIAEAGMAVSSKSRTIETSAIPECAKLRENGLKSL